MAVLVLWASDVSAQVQTPAYCLACIESAEGEPGTRVGAPNLHASEYALSWAPTGDRYLFFSLNPPRGRAARWLYGIGQIDPPSQRIALDATGWNVQKDIVWSPDGKYLAYASAPKEEDGWVDRITVIESSGEGKAHEIVRSAPHPQSPSRRYYNLTWLNLPVK